MKKAREWIDQSRAGIRPFCQREIRIVNPSTVSENSPHDYAQKTK
jgi:hypothetical protein